MGEVHDGHDHDDLGDCIQEGYNDDVTMMRVILHCEAWG